MALANCLNIDRLRDEAARRLPRQIYDFLEGGADDEWTARQNRASFDHYPLSTRTLVDVENIDTGTRLLGTDIDWPVIVAPTGASQLFHHTAEPAVARAAASAGTWYALSTMSNTSLETVAEEGGNGPKMLQVYVFRDRKRVTSLVARCREAGYTALCLTVDTPLSGNRERDRANGMSIPPRWTVKNVMRFAARPAWSLNALLRCEYALGNFADVGEGASGRGLAMDYVNRQFDRSVTWKDAEWLARLWDGPFVVKGILSPGDAKRAAGIGANAVWISNHGGRQLDGVSATADCISGVRQAVGPDMELVVDGGIRRGTHVLKALALGADACALGRPCLYGLAAAGEAGAGHALKLLRDEFQRAMALAGCPDIASIGPHVLHARQSNDY